MASNSQVKISDLPEATGIKDDDFLLIQGPDTVSRVKFKNVIIGPENTLFYDHLNAISVSANAVTTKNTDSVISLNNSITGAALTLETSLLTNSLTTVSDTNHLLGFIPTSFSPNPVALDRDTGSTWIYKPITTASNYGDILQPTNGGTTGRWQRNLTDYIDPEWYGASSSATAAVNTTAIQAAIDRSQATGIPVKFLTANTYNVNTLTLGTNVVILGCPGATLNFSGTVSNNSYVYITGTNVIVRDIKITGSNTPAAGIYIHSTATGCRIQDCTIDTVGGDGIYVNSNYNFITCNFITNNTGYGIEFANLSIVQRNIANSNIITGNSVGPILNRWEEPYETITDTVSGGNTNQVSEGISEVLQTTIIGISAHNIYTS